MRHYDAGVVTQLLEFLYRYTSDVLESAQVPAHRFSLAVYATYSKYLWYSTALIA